MNIMKFRNNCIMNIDNNNNEMDFILIFDNVLINFIIYLEIFECKIN